MTASRRYELVAIGASWGGLAAVGDVLSELGPELPVAVVVAQHRAGSDSALADLLSLRGRLSVGEIEDKESIEPGRVYVAPPDYHVLVEPGHFALSTDERVQYARPSIDVLFESAADAYGDRVIGVILTGANEDGAAGLARIKERGGYTIVQDPGGAERREMPDAAIAGSTADAVLPLEEIGPRLRELCSAPARSHA